LPSGTLDGGGKTTREGTATVRLLLTLGTLKYSLLLAGGKGSVDVASIGGIGGRRQCVVGSDVLLDCLTTIGGRLVRSPLKAVQNRSCFVEERRDENNY
jgi:hypothetical protein